VFGRSHFAVSYHGASVFPDTVMIGLEQPAVRELVTGKFVMEVREDDDRNRALWIAVELSPAGALAPPEPLGDAVAEAILASLLRRSSEFANYVPAARQRPEIPLWPTGHPDYVPVGVKHRHSRQLRRVADLARIIHHAIGYDHRGAGISWRTAGFSLPRK
jgi:phenylacetate-CoA ligase